MAKLKLETARYLTQVISFSVMTVGATLAAIQRPYGLGIWLVGFSFFLWGRWGVDG